MVRRRIDLGWLRVLDEAVQHRSLSGAARALGLTQPAVSYQIKRLEEQAGFPVLVRQRGGVALTPQGRRLHAIVHTSVDDIDRLVGELSGPPVRPSVRLRTDYAFSAYWLLPRMPAFSQTYPGLDVQIVATQRFLPREMEEGDVAVIFGNRHEFGTETVLLPEEVAPVCTPAFAARFGPFDGVESLARARLVNLDAPDSSPWFDWQSYFQGHRISRVGPEAPGSSSYNTYSLVIQAVIEGQGVALGWKGLVDSLLRSGVLVQVGPPLSSADRGYLLVRPARPNANSDRLVNWLSAQAAPDTPGEGDNRQA